MLFNIIYFRQVSKFYLNRNCIPITYIMKHISSNILNTYIECEQSLYMNELRFQKTLELRKQWVWVRGVGPSGFQQREFHNCRDLKERGHGLIHCAGYWALQWERYWSFLVWCCISLLINESKDNFYNQLKHKHNKT